MANTKEFSFVELDNMLSKIDDRGSISTTNAFSQIDEFIDTGNYLLNAQISGSLFGGYPNCRTIALAGETGTGKTFLALNGCRQAQKEGYHIIYCDSEAAVDAATFRKFGIDPDKVRYQPVNTPLEFKYFVANLIKAMQDAKAAKKQVPKIMLVLDSLGNLATTKERNDAITKSEKKDMTKQQELRSLFRIITMDLAGAKIPFIMTAHTYACVLGDTNVLMSDGTYKQISEIEKGEYVITLSGNQKVTDVFKYDVDEVIELEFEDGFKISCTPNHKLAVLDNDNNIVYKTVDELQEGDEVVKN